ncbi:MAG TPA: tRNA (adenosine(37)-N6)-threonylcarbamoyltransferase complex ATPase subunit type 1 TsaE [Bryobacteraceae bacterium]|nr:tRNA (adenosine(37)-N6)-threonylcarbamoyltransferase complex ATPase subunit type 1 TsaE [Bryobacteraceae bacterium]
MESRIFHTNSEEETIALGRKLGTEFSTEINGSVVLLIGELGAGKTTLAKGMVESRNGTPANEVSSPTFTLIHQYGDERPVYHIDLYRLDEAREVEGLGLDELFASRSLVLLEWAERFPALLPKQRIEIRLRTLADDTREIAVARLG